VPRALTTILATLLVGVCVTPEIVARDHPTDVEQLRWLDRADPQRDVSVAIARGDMRFIGVYGVASEVPGVSDARLRSRYRVRFLAGTSDVRPTAESRRLNTLAREYARRYNQLLLQRLASKPPRPNHAMERTADRCTLQF
jgi:hypothetical protein